MLFGGWPGKPCSKLSTSYHVERYGQPQSVAVRLILVTVSAPVSLNYHLELRCAKAVPSRQRQPSIPPKFRLIFIYRSWRAGKWRGRFPPNGQTDRRLKGTMTKKSWPISSEFRFFLVLGLGK